MWSSGERGGRRHTLTRRVLAPLLIARATSAAAVACTALLLAAAPAWAHADLVDSEPASGAAMATAPSTARLRFSEQISARFRDARLVDAGSRPVAGVQVEAQTDPRVMVVRLPRVPAGTYGIVWRVLADDDGHVTSGIVVFSVSGTGQPATTSPALTTPRPVPSWDASAVPATQATALVADRIPGLRWLAVGIRWLWLVLLAMVIGGWAIELLVLRRARPLAGGPPVSAIWFARRRVLTLAAVCAVLAAQTAVLALALEVLRAPGAERGMLPRLAALLGGTTWGRAWLVRELVLAGLALLALRLRSALLAARLRPGLDACAAGALLTLAWAEALGGHAGSAAEGQRVSLVVAALHVLAGCCWLGALPVLILIGWPGGRAAPWRPELLRAIRRPLSALLLGCGLVVGVTGLLAAGRFVEYVAGLDGTNYGRVLLAKAGIVILLGALAAFNACRWHGLRLLGGAGGVPVTRRSLALEAGAGLLVLLAAGVLLETAPARGAPSGTGAVAVPSGWAASVGSTQAAVPGSATGVGAAGDLIVSVSATPGRPGVNALTIRVASSRRPAPAPIDRVAVEIGQPGTATSELSLAAAGDGRFFGSVAIPQAGPVQANVRIRRSGQTVSVPVAWSVPAPGPANAGQPGSALAPGGGPRLAPYTDLLAGSLLALGAAGALVVRRHRRRPRPDLADPEHPGGTYVHELIPEEVP